MKKQKGKLIAVEGIDGSGKTTLCNRLVDYINESGKSAILTSAISDGCTDLGRMIGGVMRNPSTIINNDAECALMISARLDNYYQVVLPALQRGDYVVSDRWKTSLYIYQKNNMGMPIHESIANARLESFGININADLTIFLDIDPRHMHKPADIENRLESRCIDEWNRMRAMFKNHYNRTKKNSLLIDASLSEMEVFENVKTSISKLLFS